MWKACKTMKENEILVWQYGPHRMVRSFQAIQGQQDDGEKEGFHYGWLNDELTTHT